MRRLFHDSPIPAIEALASPLVAEYVRSRAIPTFIGRGKRRAPNNGIAVIISHTVFITCFFFSLTFPRRGGSSIRAGFGKVSFLYIFIYIHPGKQPFCLSQGQEAFFIQAAKPHTKRIL
jgi:hypothetical protein